MSVSTTVVPLALGELDALSLHARRCVFWEMDPAAVQSSRDFYDPEFEKEAWLSMVMLEWGTCGQIGRIGDAAVGSALYAPPRMVPRAGLFPTSPVSADAALLTSLNAEPGTDIHDLGAALVRSLVADLIRRGVRAVEAFGYRKDRGDASALPRDAGAAVVASATAALTCSEQDCMIAAELLEEFGFEEIAPHHRYPRFRLELHRDHEWKEDVEAALFQLLEAAAMTMEPSVSRLPVGAGARSSMRTKTVRTKTVHTKAGHKNGDAC